MTFQDRSSEIMGELQREIAKLRHERDDALRKCEEALEWCDHWVQEVDELTEENNSLRTKYKAEKKKRKELKKSIKGKKEKVKKSDVLHLPSGTHVYQDYKGQVYEATWNNEHQCLVDEDGNVYHLISGWAASMRGKTVNGWDVCYIWDEDEKVYLSELRLTASVPKRRV